MHKAKERSFTYYHRPVTYHQLHWTKYFYTNPLKEIKMEIMRNKRKICRYYHHEGLTTITNFTELNHVIRTSYNWSKIEVMHRAKERWFGYYHHEGLTTITNFTKQKRFIPTSYSRSTKELKSRAKERSFGYYYHKSLTTIIISLN